jgi:hypothetical protein
VAEEGAQALKSSPSIGNWKCCWGRPSRSPPSTAGSAVGGASVDRLHRQLQAGLEAPRIDPHFSYLKRTGAVTPYVMETIIKALNLQLSQETRAKQMVRV